MINFRRKFATPVLLLTCLACLVLLPASRALAIRGQVVDAADFFKPEAQEKAQQVIRDIKQKFDKDVMVETYPAVPAELEAVLRKKGKDRFYSDWSDQRFRALGVNGVYILITKNPGRVQIAVGNLTQRQAFTLADRDQLLAAMIGPFREGKFDEALVDGVEFIRDRLERNANPGGPPPVSPVGPATAPVAARDTGSGPTATTATPAPAPPATAPASAATSSTRPAPTLTPATRPGLPGDNTPTTIHLPPAPDQSPATAPTTDSSLRPLPDAPTTTPAPMTRPASTHPVGE